MNTLKSILHTLLKQDFENFSDPYLILTIYALVFIILFLENSILLAAFLPGDSLLILVGVLVSKGILNFFSVLFFFTIATSLGGWVSYLIGRLIKNSNFSKKVLIFFPESYQIRASQMFYRHGLSALLVGRFITFVRTLIPIIAGLSELNNFRFHIFNWISAFLWIFILISIGLIFGKTSLFQYYEKEVMFCLTLLPLALFFIGLVGCITFFLKNKN